jgi:hypothetical protein
MLKDENLFRVIYNFDILIFINDNSNSNIFRVTYLFTQAVSVV